MRTWLLLSMVAAVLLLTGCEGIELTFGKKYPEGWTLTDISFTPETDAQLRAMDAEYRAAQYRYDLYGGPR